MSDPDTAVIQVFLLGRFEIVQGMLRLQTIDWKRRKAASLMQYLALERRLPKEKAIDFLWPDASLSSGSNNLYRTLYALRQVLNDAFGQDADAEILTFADGVLSLNKSVWVDVDLFKQLTSGPSPSVSDRQEAQALYRGDLLPDDPYSDWLAFPRESLRNIYRENSLALAAYYSAEQAYEQAVPLLTPLLAHDPADEPIHRELMRLYALAGRRHDALRQYQTCVDALANELDLEPEPKTIQLHQQILNDDLVPPEPASRLAAPAPTTPIIAPISPPLNVGTPLLGRDTELTQLKNYVERAKRGNGRTILIGGESGLGKTRLVSEFLQSVAKEKIITLFGAAYEQEGFLAYQPVIEAIDDYLYRSQAGSEAAPQQQNPITNFKRTASSDAEQESWALFNDVANFLTQVGKHQSPSAENTPVIFWLDDLHAADEATLRLFHFLARKTRATSLLLLATYRTDIGSGQTSFSRLLNALYRERLSDTLLLKPLDEAAIQGLLSHLLGAKPASEVVNSINHVTAGNSFFVEEIALTLANSTAIEMHDDQWQFRANGESRKESVPFQLPGGLKDLLWERVARLGKDVESVLTTAAVIGRDFQFEVLQDTVVAVTDDLEQSTLLDALDEARGAHLIDETGAGYRFHHPLIRRMLYDSLSQVRRARLHTQVAEAIESVASRQHKNRSDYIEDLAFHYDRSDQRDRALDYLMRAGRNAAKVYAFEVAIDYYERALALLHTLGLAEPRRRFQLLERVGTYYKILADTPRAVSAFEQALATDDPKWTPSSKDRARLQRLAALTLLTAGRLDEASAQLQQALAELDTAGENGVERANVLYNISQVHWHRNQYAEAFDVAQQSLAVAERVNDQAALARAFEMLALACHSLGEWQQGLGYESQRSALAGPGLEVSDAFDVHL